MSNSKKVFLSACFSLYDYCKWNFCTEPCALCLGCS